MKIIIARHTGFCDGVRKAVLRIVNDIGNTVEDIYIYGPLIHNPQTVSILESRGLKVIKDLSGIDGKTIAVRTHGVPIETLREIKGRAKRVINLTCERVARVHAIVKKHSVEGRFTIVIGDRNHAEVDGIVSNASAGHFIVASMEDIQDIPLSGRYLIIAQTTVDREFFNKASARIAADHPDTVVVNTICDSTHNRQNDLFMAISEGIDAIIVAGGKNSANTARLAQISKDRGIKTFHIETESEISESDFTGDERVLVTAGASTPNWIINNLIERLYTINFRKKNFLFRIGKSLAETLSRGSFITSISTFFISLMISGSADQKSMMLAALASFFIFTMYTINNYFTRGSLVSNNPGKSRLYLEHSQPLLQLSAVCAALSVYLLSYFGPGTVFLFSALALFGTIYSMPKIKSAVGRSWPKFLRRAYLFRSMHSGIAWIATAVIIPLMNINEIKHESVLIALTASIAIIARNILADCIIFNGDFIVGNETFPTLMGMGRCQALCVALLGIELTSVILLAANSGLLFAGLLAHIALSLHAVYMIHRHSHYYPLRYELQVDAAMLFFALPAIIL